MDYGLNINFSLSSDLELLQLLQKLSQDPSMQSALNIFASRDPSFHKSITKILINPQIHHQIKLTASICLAKFIERHIEETMSNAHFEITAQILMNGKIPLECRMSFAKCVTVAIEGEGKCVKVEGVINLFRNLYQSDESGKVLAMKVIESEAMAVQTQGDFVYFVNDVLVEVTKDMLLKAAENNAALVEHWARSTIFVFDKLVINAEATRFETASLDMLSYLCSAECFSQLIIKCYFLPDSSPQVLEMKNYIVSLHRKILTQVFRLDKHTTTIHFHHMAQCLPHFISGLKNTAYVLENEEFSASVIGILSICCQQKVFSPFFSQAYCMIVDEVIPLIKLNETDLIYFEEEPEEFVHGLDDICDPRAHDALRAETARLLNCLCKEIDGATTYIYTVCFEALRNRMEVRQNQQLRDQRILKIDPDEAFLILSIISNVIEERRDCVQILKSFFLTHKQKLLNELTDIELTMMYFFFSYFYNDMFEDCNNSNDYIVFASTVAQHPSVGYVKLHFLSNLKRYDTDGPIFRNLTERLMAQDLKKYQQLYCTYLSSIVQKLTEDDLIYVVTTIMQRIKTELESDKKQLHQTIIAFNILRVITDIKELLKIDIKLRTHLKQFYALLANPVFSCIDYVLQIFNSVISAEKYPTLQQFETLKYIRGIIEYNGSVETCFFTLALFIRKTQLKEDRQIINYILEVVKISCNPRTEKEVNRRIDLGEGLMLMRLFLRKFSSILDEGTRIEILQFLASIKIGDSKCLHAILTNIYLRIYPCQPSEAFKKSLVESISLNQTAFFAQERKQAIQGICEMINIETNPEYLKQEIFIVAKLLDDHKQEIESGDKGKKKGKAKGEKGLAAERQYLTKSAKKMLENHKKEDVFVDFQNAISGVKEHNQQLYQNVMEQLPEYLHIKLKELLPLREIRQELRVINKVKGEKEKVTLEERDVEEKKSRKRKRSKDEAAEEDSR